MYCDTTHLDSGNILSQMYAADKYNLSGLASKCEEWTDQNIQTENVCPVWVCADRHQRKTLGTKAQRYVLQNAAEVFLDSSFLKLPQRLLKKLLSSDELHAKEDVIYQACLKWAKHQCSERGEEATGLAIRQALGECLHLIRFPLMIPSEFVDAMEGCPYVLDKDEEISVMRYLISGKHTIFSSDLRDVNILFAERFTSVDENDFWYCRDGSPDVICFKCDTAIVIKGITVYNCRSQIQRIDPIKTLIFLVYGLAKCIQHALQGNDPLRPHKVEIIILGQDNTTIYTQTEETFHSSGLSGSMPFLFAEDVNILPGKQYTILQRVWGRILYHGKNGQERVSSENVTFEFSNSAHSENGTDVGQGQIPAILFTTREEHE